MKKEFLSKNILEFENADIIESFYLLKSVQTKENKNGKKYLDLDVSDKTGDINGKYCNLFS